ncbi:MAG: hypothetical protein LBD31_07790 [Treponema sp.]|nr:hypothetical protein [Treponema sp.]
MKHITEKTVFLFMGLLVLALSCSRPAEPAAAEAETETADSGEEAPQFGVLLTEAGLWEVRADGKIHWKSQLNAGDTVIWKGEKQNHRRSYDNAERTFYRVDAEGDYWVQDYAIAGPAVPAVITAAGTVLYTRPDLASPARTGNITMPRYALAALLPDDDPGDEFVRISARLEGAPNPQVLERYVKAQNLSTDPAGVEAVKLVRLALAAENAVVRMELLKNALDVARQSGSLGQAAQDAEYDPVLFELAVSDNLERFENPRNFIVASETAQLREQPWVSAEVTGAVKQGDTLWITAQTKQETALESPVRGGGAPEKPEGEKLTGVWYREQKGGWVFGAGLVANPLYD